MQDELQAIASPVRRTMLALLWDDERTSSEIADRAGLARPAASQQLKVLRAARLVTVRIDGNRRLYSIRVDRLQEVRAYLEAFWGERLAVLQQTVEAEHAAAAEHTGPPRAAGGAP